MCRPGCSNASTRAGIITHIWFERPAPRILSREPAMILFFFNKPAFEQCLRAMLSRPGDRFKTPSPQSMAKVREQCHEVMKD
jgi:hypothetical protein